MEGGEENTSRGFIFLEELHFPVSFQTFSLGNHCTGPPQGSLRQPGGRGHCCPAWPTQLPCSCERAGMTCSQLLQQNNLKSSHGRPGNNKRTQKLRWGGMARDLSSPPTLLGPVGGKTRGSTGTRDAAPGSPPARHSSLSVGKTNK